MISIMLLPSLSFKDLNYIGRSIVLSLEVQVILLISPVDQPDSFLHSILDTMLLQLLSATIFIFIFRSYYTFNLYKDLGSMTKVDIFST